jgi:hypothetical protein
VARKPGIIAQLPRKGKIIIKITATGSPMTIKPTMK